MSQLDGSHLHDTAVLLYILIDLLYCMSYSSNVLLQNKRFSNLRGLKSHIDAVRTCRLLQFCPAYISLAYNLSFLLLLPEVGHVKSQSAKHSYVSNTLIE